MASCGVGTATQSKSIRVRTSMLSRGAAFAGRLGGWKEPCAVQRAVPSVRESKHFSRMTSPRSMSGK